MPSFLKMQGNKKRNAIFLFFKLKYNFQAEGKQPRANPSQAELKILQLELWLEPAWLGLITNTNCEGQNRFHLGSGYITISLMHGLLNMINVNE